MATSSGDAVPGPKTMRLRYAGTCRACGAALAAGTTGVYDRSTKSVTCVQCPAPGPLETAP
ncbi:MAG: NERD domain-containing protein, partial [Cellulomonadaceae bacterium]|nr:NERD domain-containing protein [Cellulomonadaceae bacterium]